MTSCSTRRKKPARSHDFRVENACSCSGGSGREKEVVDREEFELTLELAVRVEDVSLLGSNCACELSVVALSSEEADTTREAMTVQKRAEIKGGWNLDLV